MMREKLPLFSADLNRFGPLAIVSIATLVCLPSLLELASGHLVLSSMLERYCTAFVLATIAVRLISRVLMAYAAQNVTRALQSEGLADLEHRSDNGELLPTRPRQEGGGSGR